MSVVGLVCGRKVVFPHVPVRSFRVESLIAEWEREAAKMHADAVAQESMPGGGCSQYIEGRRDSLVRAIVELKAATMEQ